MIWRNIKVAIKTIYQGAQYALRKEDALNYMGIPNMM